MKQSIMNTNLKYVLLALACLLVGYWVKSSNVVYVPQVAVGGTTNYDYLETTDGYGIKDLGTIINSAGAWVWNISSSTASATVGTFTQGGGVRATSTDDTTATLLASDFDVESQIVFTPNVVSITLALPASSTLASFIPVAGQSRTIALINGTTTAGVGFTLAGGTGTSIRKASTTAVVLPAGLNELTFNRKSNTDIEVFVGSGI